MNVRSELTLKQICCTCLCTDRKLFQLSKINDGVNHLYYLLSSDAEAYSTGFLQDIVKLFVCWECRAVLRKQLNFKKQACLAQKQLSLMTNGSIGINLLGKSLSQLTKSHRNRCTYEINANDTLENFIEYSPDIFIKTENNIGTDSIDSLENIGNDKNTDVKSLDYTFDYKSDSLVNFTNCTENLGNARITDTQSLDHRHNDDDGKKYIDSTDVKEINIEEDLSLHKMLNTGHNSPVSEEKKEYYTIVQASEFELKTLREKKQLGENYAEAYFKCDLCVQVFRTSKILESHYYKAHTNKPDYEKCAICFQYIRKSCFNKHKAEHTIYYKCNLCEELIFNRNVLFTHLYTVHSIKIKKTPITKNPGSRPRISKPLRDKPTQQGYPCPECSKYFETSNMRYKHILKHHREGHRCPTCGKVFAYKSNLKKHEQIHAGIPREQCTQCGKFIRADFMSVHVLVHSDRESFECALCDKRFVSRATYDNHIKYSKAHCNDNSVLRFWCDTCGKGFRSKGELRDHIHCNHWGKTQYKCPICDKLLSSRRSTTRHVQRVHQGVNKTPKDKVCQICGKAFRLKKSLYEHQLIHSGDRPLSCDVCGVTFRQKASLYTHKKRVHKIFPKTKTLEAMDVLPI